MDIYENMLSEPLFHSLKEYSRNGRLHRTNITAWARAVIGWSGAIEIFDLDDNMMEMCKADLRKRIPKEYHDFKWYGSIHLGSRLSYIPWHNDNTHVINITCYLNDVWDIENAGYFIYEDVNCLKAIIPRRNLGLIYYAPLMHTVALCNVQAPLRESLQIFIDRPDPVQCLGIPETHTHSPTTPTPKRRSVRGKR